MRAAACIGLGLAGLLAGCGELRVRVDVLDPEHVRTEMSDERLRSQYRDVVAAAPGTLADRMDAQAKDYATEMDKLARRYDDIAVKLNSPGLASVAQGVRAAVRSGTPEQQVIRQGTLAESLAQGLRTLAAAQSWSGRGPIPADVRNKLLVLEATVKEPQVQQKLELRETRRTADRLLALVKPPAGVAPAPFAAPAAAAAAPEIKAASQQESAVAAITQRSIIGDGSIAATDFAYVVARAPDALWANSFNSAYASGKFGNSDMVIRLNSTADFSVKGMLFDASKVAQVASKVMTQAVLIGTQMAGVPVSTASTGTTTGGDALSKASADLAAAEGAIARREALVTSQTDAVRSLARTILGSARALETDALKDKDEKDPQRVPLHKGIDDSLTALKPLLSMLELQ